MDQNPTRQSTKKSTKATTGARRHKTTTAKTAASPRQATSARAAAQPTPVLPPKKTHTGFIVAIVIIILLILTGGGFLIWYFGYYSNPDRVVFEAAENLLGAEHLSISDGQVLVKIDSDDDQRMVARLMFETAALDLPSSTNAKLELSFYESQDPDASTTQTIRIDLGTVQLTDGVLYFKVGNLLDSIDAVLEEQDKTLDDLGPSAELVYDFVAEIDNEWWQISYLDLLEMAGASPRQISAYEDLYTCLIDVATQNHAADLKHLYSQHRFLTVQREGALVSPLDESLGYLTAPAGYSFYEVGLDFEELAEFINALPHSLAAEQVYDCFNQYIRDLYGGSEDEDSPITAEMFDEITADELRKFIPEDYYIRLAVSNFGHQIKHLLIADNSGNFAASFSFKYQAAEVSTPSSYRPITDLLEDIGELMWSSVWAEDTVWES